MERDVEHVKCVVVGNSGVGKTSLVVTRATGTFPEGYIRSDYTVPYSIDLMVEGRPVECALWDTLGYRDYDRLRPLQSYHGADIFLLCFSLVNSPFYEGEDSVSNTNCVREMWYPEIAHYCPGTPIILVGTKLDLRDDKEELERLRERNESPIMIAEGIKLQADIGAVKYMECSALTRQGLEAVFEEATRTVLETRATRKRCCIVF